MKKEVKKYWRVIQIFWQQALIYRAEMMLWWVIESIPMITMVLLWLNVYAAGEGVEGFSKSTMITYYLFGHLFSTLITVHFELHAIEEIMDGTIARFFIRPFPLTHHYVLSALGWKSLSFFVTLTPVVLLSILIFRDTILPPEPTAVLLPIFILLAIFIDAMLSLLIVAAAFFVDQGKSLSHAKWIISGIFKGSLLPLTLYPPFLKSLAELLPFKFLYNIPMQAYLGQLSFEQLTLQIGFALIWLAILMVLVKIAWNQATLRFTAVGG